MMRTTAPDILVLLCTNCIPAGAALPVQWEASGLRVRVREIPCSGKTDAQYLLHALEGGVKGVCVVSCPLGECTLAQGNYRAEIRIRTVQRLLKETGLDPGRAELLHCSAKETPEHLREIIDGAVQKFAGLVAAVS